MAKMRRTMRLVVDGQEIVVETNAVDLVKAEREGQGAVQQGLRTAHWACVRQRRPVPAKFEQFLDELDSFDDITDDDEEGGQGDLDPTQTVGSEPSQ